MEQSCSDEVLGLLEQRAIDPGPKPCLSDRLGAQPRVGASAGRLVGQGRRLDRRQTKLQPALTALHHLAALRERYREPGRVPLPT